MTILKSGLFNSDKPETILDLKGFAQSLENIHKNSKQKTTAKKTDEEVKDYQLIRALDLVKALYLYGKNDNYSAVAKKAE